MDQLLIHRMINTEDPNFNAFWSIYNESFPLNERRTFNQQIAVFQKPGYQTDLYLSGFHVAGFISFWTMKEFVFIEHFAVAPGFRNKGLGSAILTPFISSMTKLVILEIDPPVDEITFRRLRFYSSVGFLKNDYLHLQPSYRDEEIPIHLTLLTYPCLISKDQYNQFSQFQNEIVMS